MHRPGSFLRQGLWLMDSLFSGGGCSVGIYASLADFRCLGLRVASGFKQVIKRV